MEGGVFKACGLDEYYFKRNDRLLRHMDGWKDCAVMVNFGYVRLGLFCNIKAYR